ncbi:MAG TPA: type II toxin-antitoxin system RelE/ParE family toxin [Longimicrobium sp.]|nr:type II toxin-antitoxin system RelE/ParE family toxin [Longimicrobium sp.]
MIVPGIMQSVAHDNHPHRYCRGRVYSFFVCSADLLAAALYVHKKNGNPEAGDRIIAQLAAVMEKLAEFPTMGRARAEIRPRLRSFA